MERDFDRSVYQDKEKLEWFLSIMTPRQFAKDIGVSYKLINTWAIKHGLIKRDDDVKTVQYAEIKIYSIRHYCHCCLDVVIYVYRSIFCKNLKFVKFFKLTKI